MKKIALFLLVLISTASFSQADSSSQKKSRIWKALKYDGSVALKSFGNSFTQPLRWKSDDFITAGSIIAGTGILYLIDNEMNEYFVKQNDNVPNILKEFGWYAGSPQNMFLATAGVYGFGLITDNEKVRRTGVLIISSAAASGLVQSLSKNIVGRARPSSGNKNDYKPFSSEAGYHSFPSGHAILAFTMSHAIAKQFNNTWVKAGIYGIGSISPISRLWANAHWLSDIGLGIAISVVFVDGIDNFMKRENMYNYSKPKQINWRLRAGVNTIGIVGTF